MIHVYQDGSEGALQITGSLGGATNLWYLIGELRGAADQLAHLVDGGWYLEAPVQGGYGLIRKGVTMAHSAKETE